MVTSILIGFLLVASQSGEASSGSSSSMGAVSMPAQVVEVSMPVVALDASVADASVASPSKPEPLPFDPKVGPDGSKAIEILKKAVHDKDWFLVAGMLLFLLVLLSRNILLPLLGVVDPEDYDKWLPRISVILSILPSLAVKFVEPNVTIVELLTTSIGCYVLASGAWKESKGTMKKVPSVPKRKKKLEAASAEPKKEN